MIPSKSIYDNYDKVDGFNNVPSSVPLRGRTSSDFGTRKITLSGTEIFYRGRSNSDRGNGAGVSCSEVVKIHNAVLSRSVQNRTSSMESRPISDRVKYYPGASSVFDHTQWAQHIGVVEPLPLPSRIPFDSNLILMPATVDGDSYTFNKISRFINAKKDEGRLVLASSFMSGIALSLEHGWEGNEPPGKLYWCPQDQENEQLLRHYTSEEKMRQTSWLPKYYLRSKRLPPLDCAGKEYQGKSYWCAFSKKKMEEGAFSHNLPSKEELCTLYMINTLMGKVNMTSEKVMCQDIVPGIFKPERVFAEIKDNQININSTEDLQAMTRSYSILRSGKDSDWN